MSLILLSLPPPVAQWLRSQLLSIREKVIVPSLTCALGAIALSVAVSHAARLEINVQSGLSMSCVLFSTLGQVILSPLGREAAVVFKFLICPPKLQTTLVIFPIINCIIMGYHTYLRVNIFVNNGCIIVLKCYCIEYQLS